MLRLLFLSCLVAGCSCPRRSGPPSLQPFGEGLPVSGQWRAGFSLVDLDGDGRVDLLHGPPRKGERAPHLFLNDGAGHFTRARPQLPDLSWDYGDAVALRLDGKDELVFGIHLGGLRALRRESTGWVDDSAGLPTTGFSSRALAVTDWTGDGRPDVLALSDGPRPGTGGSTLGLRLFTRGADAWEPRPLREQDGRFGDALAVGDFDGDGRDDVATASHTLGEVRLVDFAKASQPAPALPLPERVLVRAVAAGDLDGDGRAELLLALTVPRGSAFEHSLLRLDFDDGAWRAASLPENAELTALTTADLDGDGHLDLAMGDAAGGVRVLRNDGRGALSATPALAPAAWRPGCRVSHLAAAPLDAHQGDELVASFALEDAPPGVCPSFGGLQAFTWR